MTYTFQFVQRPAIQVAGLTVQTDMANAIQDCRLLWQRYFSCLDELGIQQSKLAAHDSYGVSVMKNEKQFVYWAANEYFHQDALPVEFQVMTLPAGMYVCCEVPNLTEISSAFGAMCSQAQEQYAVDMQAPCFELYSPKWAPQDPITLYALITSKTS